MKIRVSDKDLLLLFGVVIAVIIALTTLVFRDAPTTSRKTTQTLPNTSLNTSPSSALRQAIDRIEFNSLIR